MERGRRASEPAIVEEVGTAIAAASASSPDLNPCDFWQWAFLKYRVYHGRIFTNPTLIELRQEISQYHWLRGAVTSFSALARSVRQS
ncbi:hypothetical protein AVEN_41541-1 [Araneus ventricosus]|uniref:Uncharacterized protein n=1 Tax=Araneus ventricosus TaxID=182803 RepID=A0A4Y2RGX4_ARAVE|nr:hypothetical protein AVEN_203789-1 [Araneus ventricosus]GBN74630.1 hypothetical protein AVEN_41541-1 [Araneus ventricosus]